MTKRATTAGQRAYSAARPRVQRRVRRSSLKKRIKTFFALSFLLTEAAVAILLVSALIVFWNYSTKLPRVEEIVTDFRPPVATTIWSNDGVLLGKLEVENRQPITLSEMPKNLLNATIAIEDHRFYEHNGVDIQGIARAAWANLHGESIRQGGSTLTQQLIRNIEQFGVSKEKKLERKLKEAVYAMRLEQIYSKNDILQLYLNNIYYGGGAYGVQAASRTFFGKSAYKLSLAEAALLAGLPQRPSRYSPFEDREAAINRRNDVLDRMREYGYITQAQYKRALAEKPRFMPRRQRHNFDFKAPYFTTYVINDLISRYGADLVYSGFRIETTLNWKMQEMAEKALLGGLERASGLGANQGALVSLDPNSGYIRAMVGGRSFHADQYNAVTQGKRQPGSTFKAFDYAAAFDTGTASLRKSYRDVPIPYPNDPKHRVVKNYSGRYSRRYIDCLNAIKHSTNTIAVQAAKDVGIQTVIEYAHRMGITTELAPYLPTALGASAVRPLDLCSAYSVFPAKGDRCLPMAIVRVTDAEGNLIEEHIPQKQMGILKSETVQQMDTAFEAVVTSGTGTRARGTEANGIVENAHGKTGTTSDNRDAWFAGYTPELTTVIWVASVHRSKRGITYAEMPGATGGHLCAPIWHDFMIKAVPEQRKFRQNGQAASAATSPAAKPAEDKAAKAKAKLAGDQESAPKDKKADAAQPPETPGATPGETPGTEQTGGEENGAPAQAPPTPTVPSEIAPLNRQTLAAPPRPITPAVSSSANGGARAAPPAARPVAARPVAPRPAEPDMVSVRICVDSEARANPYCDATKVVRMTRRQARRLRTCRLHRPPPGEE